MDVRVYDEAVDACGLDSSLSYFAYSSAELSDTDRELLGQLGHCLSQGRLKGRSILVTGFTDKLGDPENNIDLGMMRAEKVALQLAANGVSARRIYIRSRGERLATGDDVDGRAHDRRVELRRVERDF